jgi:hypothetical protein
MIAPPPRRIPPLGPGKRSARQRALAQWRGVDLAPLEKARTNTAKSAAAVLPKVLGGLKLDRRQTESEVLAVWNSLKQIDPLLMAHGQPTGLNNKGTLFVTVSNSAALLEFKYRQRQILERLQHSFGKDLIARISFRVG